MLSERKGKGLKRSWWQRRKKRGVCIVRRISWHGGVNGSSRLIEDS
jgi:hypothetical protein